MDRKFSNKPYRAIPKLLSIGKTSTEVMTEEMDVTGGLIAFVFPPPPCGSAAFDIPCLSLHENRWHRLRSQTGNDSSLKRPLSQGLGWTSQTRTWVRPSQFKLGSLIRSSWKFPFSETSSKSHFFRQAPYWELDPTSSQPRRCQRPWPGRGWGLQAGAHRLPLPRLAGEEEPTSS